MFGRNIERSHEQTHEDLSTKSNSDKLKILQINLNELQTNSKIKPKQTHSYRVGVHRTVIFFQTQSKLQFKLKISHGWFQNKTRRILTILEKFLRLKLRRTCIKSIVVYFKSISDPLKIIKNSELKLKVQAMKCEIRI